MLLNPESLAGVSSAKGKVTLSPLNMCDVVKELIQQRLAASIKDSHAQIEMPQSCPVVQGYGPWIEEIWMNYISNGLKYGGQPPYLQLGTDKTSDGMIRSWVRDRGKGTGNRGPVSGDRCQGTGDRRWEKCFS